MKVAISYFVQIRNFKTDMIPVSTAIWDPKWYHDNKDPFYVYKDKRGVWNGLRMLDLAPGDTCTNLCHGNKNCDDSPEFCLFLKRYRQQLDNLNFNKVIEELRKIGSQVQRIDQLDKEPIIVLMVYEKYDNPCSEREILKQWFKDHNMELEELKYPIKDNY